MNFYTRKLIKPGDLNGHNTLFGGQLLKWIDEEAFIYAVSQLGNNHVVTKYISEINFVSSAQQGDIVEIGLEFLKFGRTSITFRCAVRNIVSKNVIIEIEKIVFVNLGADGKPAPHGVTV
ncbi:MAG: acyl-CoA thioesterase [Saprospiraceae bacterium]